MGNKVKKNPLSWGSLNWTFSQQWFQKIDYKSFIFEERGSEDWIKRFIHDKKPLYQWATFSANCQLQVISKAKCKEDVHRNKTETEKQYVNIWEQNVNMGDQDSQSII